MVEASSIVQATCKEVAINAESAMATQYDDTTSIQLGEGSLQEHAAVLRTFAWLLSSHLRYTDRVPTTSQELLLQQQTELPHLFTCSPLDDIHISLCSIPCLQLRMQETINGLTKKGSWCDRPSEDNASTITTQSLASSSLEHDTAANLGRRIAITREEISNLPSLILTNLSATFETLWQARMRQAVKALVSRGSTAFDEINVRLLAKLATQPLNSVVSTFDTLDFVDRCKAQVNEEDAQTSPRVVVPVVFNVVMDIIFFDPNLIVSTSPIQAPGIIQGQFSTACKKKLLLECVDLEIDTKSLLSAMMREVKLLVRKAMLVVAHKTRQKEEDVSKSFPIPILGVASGTSLDLLPGTDNRLVTGSTPTLSMELACSSVRNMPEDNNDDSVDDEQEAIAEAALILAEKTPLQVLFETGTLDAVTVGDDGAPICVEQPLLASSYGSSTTGLAENPNMPPPPKRAPSIDALIAPDTVFGHSSRKRPASD